ncbi:MAG TPA: type 1 glutamine amidotransferase domain-containing protein [Pelomicrobium sp.]|nr:type 1 glutamine amidotransferase domain-containing protein [Pelomicrobium sp.]
MRVLIISAAGFEDTELLVPWYRLREAKVPVDVVSLERGPFAGKHGYEVEAGHSVDEVTVDAYDMLILPGGKAPARLRESEKVLAIVREFFDQDKPVAAICHGPQILVSAGVMEGRTATCYQSVKSELEKAGARYRDEELVLDGNLITSRHPGDLPAFTREIMRRLAGLDGRRGQVEAPGRVSA